MVEYFCCRSSSMCIDNFFKDLFQLFLSYMEINFQKQFISFYFTVYKSQDPVE